MNKTFREHSRAEYRTGDSKPTELDVKIGALQRMADALEIIAKDKTRLEENLRWYKEGYKNKELEVESLSNTIKAMKAARTRYKNQICDLKESIRLMNEKEQEGGQNG